MRKFLRYQLIFFLYILINASSLSAVEIDAEGLELVFIFKSESAINQNFYQSAFQYYRSQQSSNSNLIIVQNIESLEDLIHYLNNQTQHIKSLTLVSHASHWSGLSIPLTKDTSNKTTSASLRSYLESKPHLVKPNILSPQSEVIIEGCGIGSSTKLLEAFAEFFSSQDSIVPKVSAPMGYMLFYYDVNSLSGGKDYFKKEIPIWEVSIPAEQNFQFKDIVNIYTEKYGDSIPWGRALEYPYTVLLQESYTHKKRFLTVSSFGYQSDIDQFDSKLDYLNKHQNISNQLQEYGIDAEHFSWNFEKTGRPDIIKITGKALTVTVFDSSNL